MGIFKRVQIIYTQAARLKEGNKRAAQLNEFGKILFSGFGVNHVEQVIKIHILKSNAVFPQYSLKFGNESAFGGIVGICLQEAGIIFA